MHWSEQPPCWGVYFDRLYLWYYSTISSVRVCFVILSRCVKFYDSLHPLGSCEAFNSSSDRALHVPTFWVQVVIMMEGTGSLHYLIPAIIAIYVGNWMAQHIHQEGAYESDLERLGKLSNSSHLSPHLHRSSTDYKITVVQRPPPRCFEQGSLILRRLCRRGSFSAEWASTPPHFRNCRAHVGEECHHSDRGIALSALMPSGVCYCEWHIACPIVVLDCHEPTMWYCSCRLCQLPMW